jgi:hypothetical protein
MMAAPNTIEKYLKEIPVSAAYDGVMLWSRDLQI